MKRWGKPPSDIFNKILSKKDQNLIRVIPLGAFQKIRNQIFQ